MGTREARDLVVRRPEILPEIRDGSRPDRRAPRARSPCCQIPSPEASPPANGLRRRAQATPALPSHSAVTVAPRPPRSNGGRGATASETSPPCGQERIGKNEADHGHPSSQKPKAGRAQPWSRAAAERRRGSGKGEPATNAGLLRQPNPPKAKGIQHRSTSGLDKLTWLTKLLPSWTHRLTHAP